MAHPANSGRLEFFTVELFIFLYYIIYDENYSRVLFDHPEFDLETVFLIDKVQKRQKLDKIEGKPLRSLGVIEGKSPYVYVSAKVAEIIDEKAQYIKNRGQSDQYYKQLIIDYLHQWGKGTKKDFIELLGDKLPDVLNDKQKENKTKNLIATLRKDGSIKHEAGNHRSGVWALDKSDNQQ